MSIATVSEIQFVELIQEVWGDQTSDTYGLKLVGQLKMSKMPYRYRVSKLLGGEQDQK